MRPDALARTQELVALADTRRTAPFILRARIEEAMREAVEAGLTLAHVQSIARRCAEDAR